MAGAPDLLVVLFRMPPWRERERELTKPKKIINLVKVALIYPKLLTHKDLHIPYFVIL